MIVFRDCNEPALDSLAADWRTAPLVKSIKREKVNDWLARHKYHSQGLPFLPEREALHLQMGCYPTSLHREL